ncbi:glutathionylspermidine synthase [Tumebacillus sp. BK434]|uniref:glutathionylspermidine synthase family protein n=1 Tax=Tumebacillus sp. BK434 TaxID=2512169 RepID=UPI001048C7CC|nr:glutathionylspermidine synthase family protein [Tumebacillus sp. BK434]TCP57597.1 glutathionylspermidine synthase [Tumebacillus sp. BK434]
MDYEAHRKQIYQPLQAEGVFTWDWMYGEEYALAGLHLISAELRQELAEATERLGAIFTKMVGVIQQGGDELLLELGIPPETFDAVRVTMPVPHATVVGRFDFAPTKDGLKMLELNADTPTGIVEAFHVNGRVCAHYGAQDPNAGAAEQFAAAFGEVMAAYAREGRPTERIWFAALDWHEEDAGTTKYLLEKSGLAGKFVALADLRVLDDVLYVLEGEEMVPVDVWYRLHALEKLVEDRDEDGYPTGEHVLRLIAEGRVAIINPPSGFLAQTKALQALIWNLHEQGQFFTAEEHAAIAKYMLPTYLENRFLGQKAFVAKPIFGREGGAVSLFAADGQPIEQDGEEFYWEQPMIYQELVEMETVEVETLKGPYRGHLLWGSFWIGGRASAINARIGGRITGNLSYFLPVGIKE